MREYYILFNCDEWKSSVSMSLVGVFNKQELIKIIKKRIKKGEYKFGTDIKEINQMSIHDIEVSLEFGYIQTANINEVLD